MCMDNFVILILCNLCVCIGTRDYNTFFFKSVLFSHLLGKSGYVRNSATIRTAGSKSVKIRFNIILTSTLSVFKWYLFLNFYNQISVCTWFGSCAFCMPCPSHCL